MGADLVYCHYHVPSSRQRFSYPIDSFYGIALKS
ncbi:MAG: hypothetical protein ACI8RD_013481, partial [Bacillariaceae sp.]